MNPNRRAMQALSSVCLSRSIALMIWDVFDEAFQPEPIKLFDRRAQNKPMREWALAQLV